MDDIDRELKLVQLQRERLALERELAIRNAGSSARRAAGAIADGVAALIKVAATVCKMVGRAFSQWWKLILFLLVLAGGISAAFAWKEQRDRAAYERWYLGKEAFVAKQCPKSATCESAENYTGCRLYELSLGKPDCKEDASNKYQQQFPEPKF